MLLGMNIGLLALLITGFVGLIAFFGVEGKH